MENLKRQQFEEIAEIPEKVAITHSIDTETSKPVAEMEINGDFEELAESIEPKAAAKTIEDEFQYDKNRSADSSKKNAGMVSGRTRSGKKEVELTDSINISTALKDKIPVDFNIDDIGSIDLQEAEKIANENILVLSEEDLIEGIDDFELVPVDDEEIKTFPPKPKKIPVTIKTASEAKPVVEEEKQRENLTAQETTDETFTEEPLKDTTITESKIDDDFGSTDAIDLNELFESTKTKVKQKEIPKKPETHKTESGGIITKSTIRTSHEHAPRHETARIEEKHEELLVENLPEQYKKLESAHPEVKFIDDTRVKKERSETERIFEENELEKITSDIVEVIEGKTKLYREAEVEEDKELVAHMLTGIAPVFEDLLLEFEDEYKYVDEEADFIHTILTEDDYSNYITYIDEYHGIKTKKELTTAIELIGLTREEIGGVEEKLFGEEYKDVNLYEIFDFFKSEPGLGGRASIGKDCTYILPVAESLLPDEKKSIELDISSETALIFEEDVEDIREMFIKTAGAERAQKVKVVDEVFDITDKVVIIDDELDIDRFAKEFPAKKSNEVKKLLKYLDGLFETLPRDTLKKFINSEYFDLYIKVLTEMGV